MRFVSREGADRMRTVRGGAVGGGAMRGTCASTSG